MKVKSEREVTPSCPTLSDPMDCSLSGSSAHGIFQARVLEWGAIAFSESARGVGKYFSFLRRAASKERFIKLTVAWRNIRFTRVLIAFPEKVMALQYSCLENPMDGGAW